MLTSEIMGEVKFEANSTRSISGRRFFYFSITRQILNHLRFMNQNKLVEQSSYYYLHNLSKLLVLVIFQDSIFKIRASLLRGSRNSQRYFTLNFIREKSSDHKISSKIFYFVLRVGVDKLRCCR